MFAKFKNMVKDDFIVDKKLYPSLWKRLLLYSMVVLGPMLAIIAVATDTPVLFLWGCLPLILAYVHWMSKAYDYIRDH